QSALRTKELTKLRDLRVDDSSKGLNVARGRSENEGKLKGKKNGSKSRPKSDSGGKFKCYYCQELGHFKKDCPQRMGDGSSSAQIAVDEEEGYE
ncbi:acylamino-acid-releasing enzyme, partial [Trifolium medium]|nr:acylamino-acid-releasing enzyme [Trifolium medium]